MKKEELGIQPMRKLGERYIEVYPKPGVGYLIFDVLTFIEEESELVTGPFKSKSGAIKVAKEFAKLNKIKVKVKK